MNNSTVDVRSGCRIGQLLSRSYVIREEKGLSMNISLRGNRFQWVTVEFASKKFSVVLAKHIVEVDWLELSRVESRCSINGNV